MITYSGTGGFGRLQLLLGANGVEAGLGASAGGRTGMGGFSRTSLLQYSASVTLDACN
jgi:hypothetical protein